MRRSALLFVLAASGLTAQTTWVVDAQGGAAFTTIQAAVQAAQDGDVVLVRPGATYNWTMILTKALTILGSASVPTQATGTLSVIGSGNGQVVIGNFIVDNTASSTICLNVAASRRVIVSNVNLRTRAPILTPSPPWTVTVSGTPHFAMHASTVAGGNGLLATSNCTVTVSSCAFTAQYCCRALSASDSRIEASNCSFTGGDELPIIPYGRGGPGIELLRSAVVLAASTVVGGHGLYSPAPPSIAMDAASNVRVDGATSLPQGISGGQPALAECGWITGSLGARGTVGSFQYLGPAGAIGVLAVSFPAPPQPLPQGLAWLDPASVSTLAIGPVPIAASLAVPGATPQGLAITAQGLLLYQGSLRLSPPVLDAIR
jgi:hypothetical protein